MNVNYLLSAYAADPQATGWRFVTVLTTFNKSAARTPGLRWADILPVCGRPFILVNAELLRLKKPHLFISEHGLRVMEGPARFPQILDGFRSDSEGFNPLDLTMVHGVRKGSEFTIWI